MIFRKPTNDLESRRLLKKVLVVFGIAEVLVAVLAYSCHNNKLVPPAKPKPSSFLAEPIAQPLIIVPEVTIPAAAPPAVSTPSRSMSGAVEIAKAATSIVKK